MISAFEALDAMLEAPWDWILGLPWWIKVLCIPCLYVLAFIGCGLTDRVNPYLRD